MKPSTEFRRNTREKRARCKKCGSAILVGITTNEPEPEPFDYSFVENEPSVDQSVEIAAVEDADKDDAHKTEMTPELQHQTAAYICDALTQLRNQASETNRQLQKANRHLWWCASIAQIISVLWLLSLLPIALFLLGLLGAAAS